MGDDDDGDMEGDILQYLGLDAGTIAVINKYTDVLISVGRNALMSAFTFTASDIVVQVFIQK